MSHDFAVNNPEIVLPSEVDLCSPIQFPALLGNRSSVVAINNVPNSDQFPDPESGIHINPWSVVRGRKSKNISP